MALKVEKRDPSPERQVVVAMLTTKSVLGAIASRWTEPGLFASKWSNLLGNWAVEHYRKYAKAPGAAVEQYYRVWAETGDPATVEMIGSFLVGLSEEAERIQTSLAPEHVIDIAGDLFERVEIKRVIERAAAYVEAGQTDKARSILDRSKRVEIGLGSGVTVATADEIFERAIEHSQETLIEYPGALGSFFGSSLYRGGFVAFWGMPKIGKSYILQELAWQAVEQSRNVAYFECGDSTEVELFQRLAGRICERPIDAEPYWLPTDLTTNEGRRAPDVARVRYETGHKMTVQEERNARRAFFARVGEDRFRLSCHPTASISVAGIEEVLDRWCREGWQPDCVFVDYADILAPVDRQLDKRDQVNQTWIGLRRLSQTRHCLVGTLSQVKADGFTEWVLTRKDFSEDNRKLAHVTSMFGINQTPAEKKEGVYRLNYIEGRGLKFFSETKCVSVAGCLSICRPFMLSQFN